MTNSASEPGDDDVLASIRRLVAATPDRHAPANGAPSGRFSGTGAGDRLLLTPALRVAEPEAGEGAPVPPAPRGLTLEDRIAELEAAVGSQASEFEPDGSEVAHVDPPEDLLRAVENLEIDSDGAEETVEDVAEETPVEPSRPARQDEPQRRGLFLAASTSDPDAGALEARPDAPPTGETLADLPAGLFFTRHDRAGSVTPIEPPAPMDEPAFEWSDRDEHAGDAGEDGEARQDDGVSHEDTAAAEEQAHEENTAVFEPQTEPEIEPETDVQAEPQDDNEAMPKFRHAGGAKSVQEPAHGTATIAEAPAAEEAAVEDVHTRDLDAVCEILLDEEKLREIVAELLRDELQGPLGEKITRNIRKLVRREIERALTVRDFD